MELGTLKDGDPVLLRDESENSGSTFDARVYRFDYEALADLKKVIGSRPFRITSFEDDHIEGTASADQHSLLFFSIPYDKGWTVTIDGVRRETVKSLNAFLAVRITPGEHTVVLDYEPRGLKPGILLSAVSLLILAAMAGFVLLRRKKTRKVLPEDEEYFDEDEIFPEEEERPEEELQEEEHPEEELQEEEHPEEDFKKDGDLPETEDDTEFLTEEDPAEEVTEETVSGEETE